MLLVISLGVILLVLLSAFFFIKPNLSPEGLSNCTAYTSPANPAINLVFFASKEATAKYADALRNSPPFDKVYDQIGINYITGYNSVCEIYKGIALLCYSKQIIKQAASCPNDVIVVVKEEPAKIRSSSYMNVLSLNSKQSSNVFLHELAHAVANLADEYVPAEIPKGSENCVSSCEEFGELGEGCFNGCSDEGHKRSIDRGLMRTLSTSEFGEFNENKIISALKLGTSAQITGKAIDSQIDCSEQNYYLLKGKLSNEKVEITEKMLETGCPGDNGAGPFVYKFIGGDGAEISSGDFNPSLIFTDGASEGGELSGGPMPSEREFYLRVPIIANVAKLEITNGEQNTFVQLSDIGRRPC